MAGGKIISKQKVLFNATKRKNNKFLMKLVPNNKNVIKIFQQRRLYMKVIDIADIATIDGKRVQCDFYNRKGCQSRLIYQQKSDPTEKTWAEWRHQIHEWVVEETTLVLKLGFFLGKWIETHLI